MVNTEVQGLNRVNLHAPLLSYLEGLKSNKDSYLVFQAAYAYQALLFVPDVLLRLQSHTRPHYRSIVERDTAHFFFITLNELGRIDKPRDLFFSWQRTPEGMGFILYDLSAPNKRDPGGLPNKQLDAANNHLLHIHTAM